MVIYYIENLYQIYGMGLYKIRFDLKQHIFKILYVNNLNEANKSCDELIDKNYPKNKFTHKSCGNSSFPTLKINNISGK